MIFSTTILMALASAAAAQIVSHCATTIAPSVPSDQTQLTVPSTSIAFLALGRGIQNYTCTINATTGAGTYTSIGALARLFDVSCITDPTEIAGLPASALSVAFNPLPDPTSLCPRGLSRLHARQSDFTSATLLSDLHTCCGDFSSCPGYLGFHSFVDDPSLMPDFDFTQSQDSATAFVVGTKVGSIASPDDPTTDVAWLQIDNADGSLAQTVFRANTAGGNPPTSCTTAGEAVSVDYAAAYWFYN